MTTGHNYRGLSRLRRETRLVEVTWCAGCRCHHPRGAHQDPPWRPRGAAKPPAPTNGGDAA